MHRWRVWLFVQPDPVQVLGTPMHAVAAALDQIASGNRGENTLRARRIELLDANGAVARAWGTQVSFVSSLTLSPAPGRDGAQQPR